MFINTLKALQMFPMSSRAFRISSTKKTQRRFFLIKSYRWWSVFLHGPFVIDDGQFSCTVFLGSISRWWTAFLYAIRRHRWWTVFLHVLFGILFSMIDSFSARSFWAIYVSKNLTDVYKHLKSVTDVDKNLQSVRDVDKNLKSVTDVYKHLKSVTYVYKNLQSATDDYTNLTSLDQALNPRVRGFKPGPGFEPARPRR